MLPDQEWEDELRSASVRTRYDAGKTPAAQVLLALRAYLDGADVLVAYNGTGADFPMLEDLAARADQPPLGGLRHVDALYLAYAVWPWAQSHRLADLAEEVGADRSGLHWHDAADDADLTARLLRRAAEVVGGWDKPLRDLLLGIGTGSPGWDLVASLLTQPPGPPAAGDGAVAQVLAAALSGDGLHDPTRRGGTTTVALSIPKPMLDDRGRTDPHALAQAASRNAVERRPAQQLMAEVLTKQVAAGRDALCEAPTGTGKSFAVLAAALDWLAVDRSRRVVLATYTKQLQSQLATDITRLASAISGLGSACDLVKGRRNRLSMRSLVAAVTDAITSGVRAGRRSDRNRFAARPEYRELLVYLIRRLTSTTSAYQGWTARSVDPADLPVFLAEYIEVIAGPVLGPWLTELSQEYGDYGGRSGSPLARMTDTVAEALANHRLVIANHALLLSNPDVFADHTLLIVDEAHSLEHAATGAASANVDYRSLENLMAELLRWWDAERRAPATIGEQIADLERTLDTEVMPKAAQAVFDAAGGEPGHRAATLASPFGGLGGSAPARHLLLRFTRLADIAGRIHRQLSGYLGSPEMRTASWWERERAESLSTKVDRLSEAARRIVADADEILALRDTPDSPSDIPEPADEGQGDEQDAPVDPLEEQLGEDSTDGYQPRLPHGDPQQVASNRVVYATELELHGLSVSARKYAFTVTSAPIELAYDRQWRLAKARFARIFYVSATLQVSGRWDYIRSRLALGSDVDAHCLAGPFDLAKQARLICLTDFPSWAEQSDGAVRAVGHQLAGYAREVVRREVIPPRSGRQHAEAFTGGALVLTTATRTASAIAESLLAELPATAPDVPVAVSPILGNARAAHAFTESGGFCVATRGMWQGVDFPADRLSLVWINKLPFAPFADPVVAARRAAVARRAASSGDPNPDRAATELYYLPLAAMDLRQAVGRLIRSAGHRGVIVISDRKLDGRTALRRSYRKVFLESLDPGLLVADPDTGEAAGGNLATMAEGWERIWRFLADCKKITYERANELCTPKSLAEHTLLPATRKILKARIEPDVEAAARANGSLGDLLVERCTQIARCLRPRDEPMTLRSQQEEVIRAVADDTDVLALLPTGFGKSYTFQLPALALSGVTVVVSPLVALMADQALELNATIGGAVRALVGPMAESNSRRGKTEVAEQLTGVRDHGIRLVYISPERLANRRFQQLLREGAEKGNLRRVAIDEAHTFVQWGDDFRPSFRRAAAFLSELRTSHGLRVTAVTATANRGVREGLRSGLFGLPAEAADGEPLVTVFEDPLRPELAIYRRFMRTAGPNAVAGLAEAVTTACDDHAIFYCLTVREVDALYAHLREFVGEGGTKRVRRFHGRMPEAEKASVLTEFRDAAAKDEEGFAPLLIVATSAFGLGVNRRDIRCVFAVSPPTDLAGLYQQLGRAGRDQVGKAPAAITEPSHGLALGTRRGFQTVAWMASQGLPEPTQRHIGSAVLTAARSSGVLDPDLVADTVIGNEIAAGRLSAYDARKTETVATYRTTVIRALATLATAGTVDDGGDFPATVTVTPVDDPVRYDDEALAAAITSVQQLAATRPGRHQVVEIHRQLTAQVPGYADHAVDAAGTWALLATMHDLGTVDVSQAGNTRTLVSVRPLGGASMLPADFGARMNTQRARLAAEIDALRDWYCDTTQCANTAFTEYFGQPGQSAPKGTCSTAGCRCSSCWSTVDDTAPQPALLRALNTPRPRPSANRDSIVYQAAVERYVRALLWDNYRGLTAGMLHRVLRGDEAFLSGKLGRLRPLWPQLLYHRLRGVDPGIKLRHVEDALARLGSAGEVTLADGERVWRLQRHVDRDRARVMATQAGATP
ncbi:ATP-dependent DNA helicase RecQ [Kutzneria buriramensis]|uniref:DNA 3'-5' helicase n=2 Tax=Kutzneria buriramensis TaxID=1045776 RepID=A0A3E0GX69_9PSEU|nr:ATP-dependent DNA helicase RecQ [Kutzneria buriramensis]